MTPRAFKPGERVRVRVFDGAHATVMEPPPWSIGTDIEQGNVWCQLDFDRTSLRLIPPSALTHLPPEEAKNEV